jgi:hypothetical protein
VTDADLLKQFEEELPELHRSGSLKEVREWVLDHAEALILRNSKPDMPSAFPAQFFAMDFSHHRYEKNIYDRKEDDYRSGLVCHCVMKIVDFNNGFRILDGTGLVVQNGKTSANGLKLHCDIHFYEEDWPTLFVMAKMTSTDGKLAFFLAA